MKRTFLQSSISTLKVLDELKMRSLAPIRVLMRSQGAMRALAAGT